MRTRLRQRSTIVRQLGSCVIALAAFGISGCRDAISPGDILPGLSIRTGAETIHFVSAGFANQITVPITVTNNSDKTLSLAFCSESLERFSFRGWERVFSPVCIAAVQTLPPIPAGTSYTFNWSAYDTPPGYSGFRFTDSQNVYRVHLGLWIVDDLGGEQLPREASVTNAFKVEP
ncbi:MAG TPA: hypothetical protein VK575_01055 [Gemmatimonadaceae bacterium]|nr:hypothetical protein [Gemmatimonadaceae bacterium]